MDDPRLKRTRLGYLEVGNKPTSEELNSYYANKYYQEAMGSYESLHSIAKHTGWSCEEIVADFPIDLYLLHSESNYVVDKSCGPAAHRARIQTDLLLSDRNIDDILEGPICHSGFKRLN